MTQNERDTRLTRMDELLEMMKEVKRRNSEDNLGTKKRLNALEKERLRNIYEASLNEYDKLFTIEILWHLPLELRNLVIKIPDIIIKTTLYGHALMPNRVTIRDFIEQFIDESAENARLIDIAIRRVSEDGLTIELPGGYLIQGKEGE